MIDFGFKTVSKDEKKRKGTSIIAVYLCLKLELFDFPGLKLFSQSF